MKSEIQRLIARLGEIEGLLGSPEILQDQKRYRELTQEHSYLVDVRNAVDQLEATQKQLNDNRELLKFESDPEFIAVLQEDIAKLDEMVPKLEEKLERLLVPPDPTDHANTILELRAGTGGDEAAIFVGDCVRMYKTYADSMGWRYEELSSSPSDMGGYKEYVMVLTGPNVYRYLRHEGGTHRVQRVPETEAQGRIHTSAITVAVLREPEEEAEITVDEKDLRIDTFRSSGAGGQHVNVTDSAVRLTHIPSGIVVACQEERSQHKNKAKAMRLLKAKLAEREQQKKEEQQALDRSSQVGSGDRSERIRTYNFPQNRVTDHRINLTLYSLDRVMQGALREISEALVAHFHQQKLAA